LTRKKTAESPQEKLLTSIKGTSPPDLYTLIEREGSIANAARASGIAKYTIAQVAKGTWPLRQKVKVKLDAYIAGTPHTKMTAEPKPTPTPPPVIPPWDKKMETVKITKADGSKQSFKMPSLIARLFEMHGNVKGAVAKSMGWSGWNPVNDAITAGKYEAKIHARAYCAVNGLPIPNGKNTTDEYEKPDAFTLGLAICLVTLSDYEALEELAEVMGCVLVFKMSAGNAGWVVIYRNPHKDKLEKFKRLGKRDAKKIVCP
jgi:hypothetical protein